MKGPAATAVTPPSHKDPALRSGWGTPGAEERPARLMQHVQSDDDSVGVSAVAAGLAAVALVLIFTGVAVVLFAF